MLTTYQIDPGLVKPSGKHNILLKEDVLKFIEENSLKKKPPKVESVAQSSQSSAQVLKPTTPAVASQSTPTTSPKFVDLELTNMRKVIAKRLLQSKTEIPHSYCTVTCNINDLLKTKDMLAEEGIKLSINDFITKSTATALQLYPKANATCTNDTVTLSNTVDVCVAVATDRGLYTPIIKSTSSKSLSTISLEIKNLAVKAKTGKLKPEEYTGGTFT